MRQKHGRRGNAKKNSAVQFKTAGRGAKTTKNSKHKKSPGGGAIYRKNAKRGSVVKNSQRVT